MLDAAGGDCTHAMYSKCAEICLYIRRHGWRDYAALMRLPENPQ